MNLALSYKTRHTGKRLITFILVLEDMCHKVGGGGRKLLTVSPWYPCQPSEVSLGMSMGLA